MKDNSLFAPLKYANFPLSNKNGIGTVLKRFSIPFCGLLAVDLVDVNMATFVVEIHY